MRINWFKDENNLVYINGATQLAELERTLHFPGLEEAANELRKHPTPEGFTIKGHGRTSGRLFVPDLAVLFGNLLENALTACMQEASPRIVVRITADAHTLCAAVDNTFTGAVRRTTGGFLSTKHAGLGLGTASVRSIAEKYHGVCRLEPRDGMFCASVLLELPQEKL